VKLSGGSARGNHYHQSYNNIIFILKSRIKIVAPRVIEGGHWVGCSFLETKIFCFRLPPLASESREVGVVPSKALWRQ